MIHVHKSIHYLQSSHELKSEKFLVKSFEYENVIHFVNTREHSLRMYLMFSSMAVQFISSPRTICSKSFEAQAKH